MIRTPAQRLSCSLALAASRSMPDLLAVAARCVIGAAARFRGDSLRNPSAGAAGSGARCRQRMPAAVLHMLLAWAALAGAALLPGAVQAQAQPTMLDPTVTQVAAGDNHSCALTTAGAVWCWGSNDHGQLGNGSATNSRTPVDVSSLGSGVAAIAAGGHHSCALTTAGAVWCWGWNQHGQLGNGTSTDSLTPMAVSGLGSVAAIAAGYAHSCALTTAGAVRCWGRNDFGQLGDGTNTDSSTPVAVSGLDSGVAAIVSGGWHSCALTTAGALRCWGLNVDGRLGDGTTTNRSTPVPVSDLDSGVAAVAAGKYHSCALTTAGALRCWGYNGSGQLGNASTTSSQTPVAVSGLGSVAAIAAGGSHTCALSTAGALQCWGYNFSGQLGDGSTTKRSTPVAVIGLDSGVAAIAAGDSHTCALSTVGAVRCWGYNGNGRLGDGSTTNSSTPVTVSGLSGGVAAVAAGPFHSCALTPAGAVRCWGGNAAGQLGNGSTTDSSTPVAVSGLGSGVAAIAVGEAHTCAMTTAGAVRCWGWNSNGQLGDSTTTNRSTPVAVSGLDSGVAAIASGINHSCALTVGGAVRCWGFNGSGQLGDGSTTNRLMPVAVSGLDSGVAAIAAGSSHTCALTTAGALWCWGANGYGQLGDATTTNRLTPVAVSGLGSGVAAIAVGLEHTCALTTAGALRCWGDNFFGQLGDGSTTDSPTPVAVSGLSSGVAAIAAGGFHSCALTQAGAVQCWGWNTSGQLGNGTTTNSLTPVAVSGLGSGVAVVTAGGTHTCALTTAGALRCWGSNDFGQLGNGSTTNASTPVSLLIGQQLAFAPGTAPAGQPLATIRLGEPLSLLATPSAGGPVPLAYDSWTPDTCAVTGTTLDAQAVALCGVRASRSGGSDGAGGTLAAAPQQLRLLQVLPAAPTLVLASAPNPSNPGQGVSFTATLAGAVGASGAVSFCADAAVPPDAACTGGTLLCTVAASASPIVCSTSALAPGVHAISAHFAGDGNNEPATSAPLTHTVVAAYSITTTPSPAAGGTLSCSPNPVPGGATSDCTVTPHAGYSIASVGGSCGGTLAGNVYTTNAITADCTVVANFAPPLQQFSVTPSVGSGNGTIAPTGVQSVAAGTTASFTLTPAAGYSIASVGGTCGGALAGTTYTTAPITANCTVIASFATKVDGACGSANGVAVTSAPTANLCTAGTETSVSGTGPWNWTCTGAGGGTDASCSAPSTGPVTHFEGPSATGTGTVSVDLSGGGSSCGFTGTPALIAAAPNATPATPAGIAFPHGLFSFTASDCTPGSTITLTMKLPAAVPDTAKYWKWGPTSDNATPHWYEMPATISGDTVTLSITDGGQGDSDLDAANGSITDPGGVGVPGEVVPPGTVPVITSGAPPAASVGQPYRHAVTARGSAPLTFGATGLPAGLVIDAASGLISGTPTTAGSHEVTITVSNAAGSVTQTMTLMVTATPAAVTPVPTLGEWGLMLLGLLAAGLGARRLRHRT